MRQFLAVGALVALASGLLVLGGVAVRDDRHAQVDLGPVRDELVEVAAGVAVAVGLVLHAVRQLRDALLRVVDCEFEPRLTVVAVAVVVLVLTVRDDVHADLVVVLDLLRVAHLHALAACGAVHLAVEDRRAAQVLGDFHVGVDAVDALVLAALVLAVRDGRDAHVFVLGQEVAVDALEAHPVAVLVAAVGDFRHALLGVAVLGEHEAFGARVALTAVTVTTLVCARRLAGDRGADPLRGRVRERDAVLVRVVRVARLALETLLRPGLVCGDEAVGQVLLGQEGRSVLVAHCRPVCVSLASLALHLD